MMYRVQVMTERLGDREWFSPGGIRAAVSLAVGLDLNSEAQVRVIAASGHGRESALW